MIRATYSIDGQPGELTFVDYAVARDHMRQMIEHFGTRLKIGGFESCAGIMPALPQGVALLPSAAFLER